MRIRTTARFENCKRGKHKLCRGFKAELDLRGYRYQEVIVDVCLCNCHEGAYEL